MRTRFSIGAREFRNRWSEAGPTHHMAAAVGRHIDTILKVAKILDVPVGREIAVATSELMKKYDLVIWAHHGMFAAGEDFTVTLPEEFYMKNNTIVLWIQQEITDFLLFFLISELQTLPK